MVDDELDVWLGARRAGRLTRAVDGRVAFDYDPAYLRGADSTPLSASMPMTRAAHGPEVVGPWLSNLLPDNERVLERWADEFGTRDISAFGLLRYMGADCPGAVQILPDGVLPDAHIGGTPQTEAGIARRIEGLRDDDAAWSAPDDVNEASEFGRFSLAGAQGKFALTETAKGWELPIGHSASTHIFKVGVRRIADLDVAEYVTTRAAGALGLPVPEQRLLAFGGHRALVSRRYDRYSEHGLVQRIHQEDFCQALGVWPRYRYEKDAHGPTLADLAYVVDELTGPAAYREVSRELLARATAFNLMSIGTDAHAKNHSLLHVGPETTMAPLYDLGSAAFAYDGERLSRGAVMAVSYGGSRRVAEIRGPEILRTADALGIDRDAYTDLIRRYAATVPDAIAQALRECPVLPEDNPLFVAAPGVLQQHAARVLRDLDRVRSADVVPVPAVRRYGLPR